MSSQKQTIPDQKSRIVDALSEKREGLEELAESDTAFAPRAEAALEWLEEHTEETEDA